jgi:AAA family ATP:ADP antiporter
VIGGRDTGSAAFIAVLSAAVIIAHQVAAKATRQALFLASFQPESLPQLIILAALFSLVLVVFTSRAMARLGPARLIPAAFWVSGFLHLAEWVLVFRFKTAVAVAFYLHFAGLGSVLISGFWSMVNERFDPHTAKRRMGQIAGGGTVGAVLGGAVASLVGMTKDAASMLPILCVMHLVCGSIVRGLRPAAGSVRKTADETGGLGAGARLLARHPYLRHLALLVLLGAAGASLAEYVFVARAKMAVPEDSRMPFFALFYTATSLVGCFLQIAVTRLVLEKSGIGVAVSVHPATVALGGLGAALIPGLPSAGIARGSEQVVHNTLFRSAYELFYTPVPAAEKRAAKPFIDVGIERLGDMAGAALSRGCLWLMNPGAAQPAILATAAGAGLLGVWIARRLDRGYVVALERSLRDRAVELDLEDVQDQTTRAILTRSLAGARASLRSSTPARNAEPSIPLDPVRRRLSDFGSGDPARVREALEGGPLDAVLTARVIPLLAWDAVAEDAQRALRRAGAGIAGQLIDSMLDTRQEFTVRRRIPRVLAAFPSARAVDALLVALNDRRFEVRYRCGKALAAVLAQDAGLCVTNEQILPIVLRELELSKRLWKSQRLLDGCEEDELVGDRANHGLAHVFTLLSLILPKEPLQLSFQALHTDDEMLRGTALEYLESILPAPIRDRLWPFLEDKRSAVPSQRSREVILTELLLSHESIRVRLQQLRAREATSA